MFPMTITLQNAAQLNAVLAALNLGTAAAAEPTTAQLVEIAERRGETVRAAKETAGKSAATTGAAARTSPTATEAAGGAPEKTAGASTQAAGNAAAAPQVSTAATEAVTYDVVAKAITEKAKSDRAHVVATLDTFGVKKGTELKPDQYADFLKALG